jgi:hypothetical protein
MSFAVAYGVRLASGLRTRALFFRLFGCSGAVVPLLCYPSRMQPGTVTTALQLVTKASRVLTLFESDLRPPANVALKENISGLYDAFLDLKAILLRLRQENAELRDKLAGSLKIIRSPKFAKCGKRTITLSATKENV